MEQNSYKSVITYLTQLNRLVCLMARRDINPVTPSQELRVVLPGP
jgi:hypothetical protein